MTPAAANEARLRLLADEDFNASIARGLLIRMPDVDVVDVHEVGLGQTEDHVILEWAAAEGRVLLTHDENTMTAHAYARIKMGLAVAGVVVIPQSAPIGPAIDGLLLLLGAGTPADVRNRVVYLPL